MIHNPDAGDDNQPSAGKLLKWIRTAGHKVDYQSSKEKKWQKVLKNPGDVVAVAGGDGTVGKVARRLSGTATPIAVLPMGTANNIASALGMSGMALRNLIAGWKGARCVHFDAATARGPWGSRRFIEGFGLGLFAEAMFCLHNAKENDLADAKDPEHEIDLVLKILKSRLQKFKPRQLTVRLDGEDLSGKYVLLEALNIGFIGPNLNLAPQANTNDGLLDIVAVPHDRQVELEKYLNARLKGTESPLKLPRHRGRHLQIESDIFPLHIDDKGWPNGNDSLQIASHAVSVSIDPGALIFLLPKIASRGPAQAKQSKSKATLS